MPIIPTDPFTALFAHATPSARAFFAGSLCVAAEYDDGGYLHVLRKGSMRVVQENGPDILLDEPALLFFARSRRHRFFADPDRGADLVCARVDLGGGEASPVAAALPVPIVLKLAEHEALAPACTLLFAEAFAEANGRQAALDRLFDYLVIVLIRHVVAIGAVERGVLAGLADPRLQRALAALHASPGKAWSLEGLADEAAMSRTRFAEHFRAIVGRTPMDYLTHWRMIAALGPLQRGRPVKTVAASVGYKNAAAFTRTFARVMGVTPTDWVEQRASKTFQV